MVRNSKAKFSVGTFRGGDDGEQFELLCFHCFKFSGVQFKVIPLTNTVSLRELDIIFPAMEVLPLDWKVRTDCLKQDKLYIPPVGNLESGDAFCVMTINNVLTLVVLQVTIAENHPVKMNGLTTIYNCYNNTIPKVLIKNKILIFVTPKNGTLKNNQNLVTQNGKNATTIPANIRPFANNQYKIENALK